MVVASPWGSEGQGGDHGATPRARTAATRWCRFRSGAALSPGTFLAHAVRGRVGRTGPDTGRAFARAPGLQARATPPVCVSPAPPRWRRRPVRNFLATPRCATC